MKEDKKSFLADLSDDMKQYGFLNHIVGILFTIFYLHISKKLQFKTKLL
ncbi:hypothetical protein OAR46_00500 [Candidatus Pelagibacter sp.]|nr:hypothetical protein [Candidatus Pelagibacter sp.]